MPMAMPMGWLQPQSQQLCVYGYAHPVDPASELPAMPTAMLMAMLMGWPQPQSHQLCIISDCPSHAAREYFTRSWGDCNGAQKQMRTCHMSISAEASSSFRRRFLTVGGGIHLAQDCGPCRTSRDGVRYETQRLQHDGCQSGEAL